MVATQEKRATRIGVEVLEKGGNAVDAAVAIVSNADGSRGAGLRPGGFAAGRTWRQSSAGINSTLADARYMRSTAGAGHETPSTCS